MEKSALPGARNPINDEDDMDAQHFDLLTQQLGRALSRRHFGALLAALGFGAGLGVPPTAASQEEKEEEKAEGLHERRGQVRQRLR